MLAPRLIRGSYGHDIVRNHYDPATPAPTQFERLLDVLPVVPGLHVPTRSSCGGRSGDLIVGNYTTLTDASLQALDAGSGGRMRGESALLTLCRLLIAMTAHNQNSGLRGLYDARVNCFRVNADPLVAPILPLIPT